MISKRKGTVTDETIFNKFLQATIDRDVDASMDVLESATDEELALLVDGLVYAVQTIAGYALKRGIDLNSENARFIRRDDTGH